MCGWWLQSIVATLSHQPAGPISSVCRSSAARITPPVCGAVFIAAGMIEEDWLKVAFTAMALGVGLYIIPLGMIANPDIIALASSPVSALVAFLQIALGLGLVSYGLIATRSMVWKLPLLMTGGGVILGGAIIG